MKNKPALVAEVSRGNFVESRHAVDCIIADASGNVVTTFGNEELEIFPRSAIKSLQALPLVESGAADAFGFEDKHLALACSSHNAQSMHVETALDMLNRSGVEPVCLECGAQPPQFPQHHAELIEEGTKISAIHNNCSGKHAGFLAFARHNGINLKNYIDYEHPVQQEIASTLQEVTGSPHGGDNFAIDGCSIPTYMIPLKNLAIAYAKFSVGEDPSSSRSKAMLRLRDACMHCPEMVAGDFRACTRIMNAAKGRVFVKVGAEGVYTVSLPENGLGIAMKARDGNFRAVEVATAFLIEQLIELNDSESQAFKPLSNPTLKNWNGLHVGQIQVAQ